MEQSNYLRSKKLRMISLIAISIVGIVITTNLYSTDSPVSELPRNEEQQVVRQEIVRSMSFEPLTIVGTQNYDRSAFFSVREKSDLVATLEAAVKSSDIEARESTRE